MTTITTILAQSLRRLSAGRSVSSARAAHAFSFATRNNNDEGDGDDGDDLEKYIGARRGQSLAELKTKWDRLRKLGPRRKQDDDGDDKDSRIDQHRLGPLGYVFGGYRASQVEHVRILAGEVLARLMEVEGRSSAGVLFTGTTGENGHEVKRLLDECLAAAAGRDNDSNGGGEHDGNNERLVQLFDIVEYAATVVRLGDVLVAMRCSQKSMTWDIYDSAGIAARRNSPTELIRKVERIVPQSTQTASYHHNVAHGSKLGRLVEVLSRAATKYCSESIAAAVSAGGEDSDGEEVAELRRCKCLAAIHDTLAGEETRYRLARNGMLMMDFYGSARRGDAAGAEADARGLGGVPGEASP